MENDIDNYPQTEKAVSEVVGNINMLVNMLLDPLRELAGMPIYISSGYRCKELNKRVGGAEKSQHLTGRAADITTNDQYGNMILAIELLTGHRIADAYPYMEGDEDADELDWLSFDQMILYRQTADKTRFAWIHVSYKSEGENRNEVLDCYKGVYRKVESDERERLVRTLCELVTLKDNEKIKKYKPSNKELK